MNQSMTLERRQRFETAGKAVDGRTERKHRNCTEDEFVRYTNGRVEDAFAMVAAMQWVVNVADELAAELTQAGYETDVNHGHFHITPDGWVHVTVYGQRRNK